MTRIDMGKTISEFVGSAIETGAGGESVLSSAELNQNQMAWDKVIDEQLIEWARDPGQLEDDGIEPPSRPIISLACELVRTMRDNGCPRPLRVVPNGDGGITFERKDGSLFQAIEIQEDGTIEFTVFENSRLVFRQPIK